MASDGNDAIAAPRDVPAFRQLSVAEAHALVASGDGVLVDTRGRKLYDNAHARGAVSLPLSEIEAANRAVTLDAVPSDRLLILYCA
jgi:rhodanese-related sulfurtransferase